MSMQLQLLWCCVHTAVLTAYYLVGERYRTHHLMGHIKLQT